MYIALFILALIIMITLHEAGHMIAAKLTGMRVERFSVFFGPALFKKTIGETEYRFGIYPLGGYVRISGMTEHEEPRMPEEIAHRAYWRQPLWKRVTVILAGPMTNVALAVACFAVFAWTGQPNLAISVDRVTPDSVAWNAGVRPGDYITGATGPRAAEGVVPTIRGNAGSPVTLRIVRGGEERVVTLTPRRVNGVGKVGMNTGVAITGVNRMGPVEGLGYAVGETGAQSKELVSVWARFVTDEKARANVSTVFGITAVSGELSALGLWWLLVASVSLALAIVNLLPIYPLDGGQILVAVIERLRGRSLPLPAYNAIALCGIGIMIAVFSFGLRNDIAMVFGAGIF